VIAVFHVQGFTREDRVREVHVSQHDAESVAEVARGVIEHATSSESTALVEFRRMWPINAFGVEAAVVQVDAVTKTTLDEGKTWSEMWHWFGTLSTPWPLNAAPAAEVPGDASPASPADVSAEDRAAIAPVFTHRAFWSDERAQHECNCGSVLNAWLNAVERRVPKGTTPYDFWMREHQIDALLAAGWRPGGAPARPTREALAGALYGVLNPHMGTNRVAAGSIYHAYADSLLAVDHLWAEDDGPLFDVRRCRVCGCTDEACSGCIEKTGSPCSWVEWDLCSACDGVVVVDREALAAAMYRVESGGPWDMLGLAFREDYLDQADELIREASGALVDRATVEAEQREKDAEIAEGASRGRMHGIVDHAYKVDVAAAIRAGGAS
jgi:hypothetical protein